MIGHRLIDAAIQVMTLGRVTLKVGPIISVIYVHANSNYKFRVAVANMCGTYTDRQDDFPNFALNSTFKIWPGLFFTHESY